MDSFSKGLQYYIFAKTRTWPLLVDEDSSAKFARPENGKCSVQLNSHESWRLICKIFSVESSNVLYRIRTSLHSHTHSFARLGLSRVINQCQEFAQRSQLSLECSSSCDSNDGLFFRKLFKVKSSGPPKALRRAASSSPNTYASTAGVFQLDRSHFENCSGNWTDLSTISLSKFPEPPQVHVRLEVEPNSISSESLDIKRQFYDSPDTMRIAYGGFTGQRTHNSHHERTDKHLAEKQKTSTSDLCSTPAMAEWSQAASETGNASREGLIRFRPLYNDLNSAYQSITSRKTDAYLIEMKFGSPPESSETIPPKHHRCYSDAHERESIGEPSPLKAESKRNSRSQILQRMARAFSLRDKEKKLLPLQRRHSDFREKSRGYFSGLFSPIGSSVKESETSVNFERNLSNSDVEIGMGRRRSTWTPSNSLFDWTDEGPITSSREDFRDFPARSGSSPQGTDLSCLRRSYPLDLESNHCLYHTASQIDYPGPRVDSTIGSILNWYDHTHDSYQAMSSIISLDQSSISSSSDDRDLQSLKDDVTDNRSVASGSRPMSKMLPPPLLLRSNPAYAGAPPRFPAPIPDVHGPDDAVFPRQGISMPSNMYSTASSYENTRDLLLMSQSTLSSPFYDSPRSTLARFWIPRDDVIANGGAAQHSVPFKIQDTDKQRSQASLHHSSILLSQQANQQGKDYGIEKRLEDIERSKLNTNVMENWPNRVALSRSYTQGHTSFEYKRPTRQYFTKELYNNCEIMSPPCTRNVSDEKKTNDNGETISRPQGIDQDDKYLEGAQSIEDNNTEDGSEGWVTVAEPSHPHFAFNSASMFQGAVPKGYGKNSYHDIPIATFSQIHKPVHDESWNEKLHDFNLKYPLSAIHNNQDIANYSADYALLAAEPHDDIEYNIDYYWKMAPDDSQTYNNNSENNYYDIVEQERDFVKDFVANNNIEPFAGANVMNLAAKAPDNEALRQLNSFERADESSSTNQRHNAAVQELHSGDLLAFNSRSAQPSQIFIPPRYRSLRSDNLATRTPNPILNTKSNLNARPNPNPKSLDRYPRKRPIESGGRRKRASVCSQKRLKSFSLTSGDRLLSTSPTVHHYVKSTSTFHCRDCSIASPRAFDTAPSLQRNTVYSAANTKSRQRLGNKLSWLLLGTCCLFPPALVCYGVGWMDAVIYHLSHGKVEHVGRTQRQLALALGTFICTVGTIIIIAAVVMLHLTTA